MASIDDVVTVLNGLNKNISQLIQVVSALFPRISGTFTMPAAATLTVAQPGVRANSIVQVTPNNAAAATLMGGAKSLYVSALTAGTGFTVATASATNAAGTETFSYVVVNP